MMSIVYHTGRLDVDRLEDGALDKKASSLMRRAQERKVLLFQRRLDENLYEYHAYFIKGAM